MPLPRRSVVPPSNIGWHAILLGLAVIVLTVGCGTDGSHSGGGSGGNNGGTSSGNLLEIKQFSGDMDHGLGCVLFTEGRVRCWGLAAFLGLGDGRFSWGQVVTRAEAYDVDMGDGKAIAIGVGFEHACALIEGGAVRCWGRPLTSDPRWAAPQGYGRPTQGAPSIDGDVPVGGAVSQLFVNYKSNCAITATGALRCWGHEQHGDLGHGLYEDFVGDDETPATLGDVDLGGARVLDVAHGLRATCVLLDNAEVHCWGAIQSFVETPDGQNRFADYDPPVGPELDPLGAPALPFGDDVIDIEFLFGGSFLVARSSDGSLRCFPAFRDLCGDASTPPDQSAAFPVGAPVAKLPKSRGVILADGTFRYILPEPVNSAATDPLTESATRVEVAGASEGAEFWDAPLDERVIDAEGDCVLTQSHQILCADLDSGVFEPVELNRDPDAGEPPPVGGNNGTDTDAGGGSGEIVGSCIVRNVVHDNVTPGCTEYYDADAALKDSCSGPMVTWLDTPCPEPDRWDARCMGATMNGYTANNYIDPASQCSSGAADNFLKTRCEQQRHGTFSGLDCNTVP